MHFGQGSHRWDEVAVPTLQRLDNEPVVFVKPRQVVVVVSFVASDGQKTVFWRSMEQIDLIELGLPKKWNAR